MAEEKQTTEAAVPELRDTRVRPEGVVPKQSQAYVIAGLAVVILLAVMFSKSRQTAPSKPSPYVPYAAPSEANDRKIADLKEELDAAQRASEHAVAPAPGRSGPAAGTSPPTSPVSAAVSSAPLTPEAEPQHDPVKDAERELAFKARFASNLVGEPEPSRPEVATAESSEPPARSAAPIQGGSKVGPDRRPEISVNSATAQPYALFEGTTIDTALLNRITADFAGPMKVMVTNPVYSHDRQHVLVPDGTFLLGEVQPVASTGQRRVAVVFHRLLMPDGYSVDLDRFHGLSQQGETGLTDQVNNHYLQVFGTSIALGVIAGAAESTTSSGYSANGSDALRQGVASSLAQSGAHVLDRFLNILPTITIREGQRIKVYLTEDLLLPAYEDHTVPKDI